MNNKLVLIDGHSILNRAFYGMPDLSNAKGVHTGAVYGFLNIMLRILEEEKADYLTVVFDEHAPTFRHEYYPAYKGTRHAMPDELREQVPLIKEVLETMGIQTMSRKGLEADDILGTLAKKSQANGMEVTIVSGDRDLLQIADEHILIRIPKTRQGKTIIENYHAADVLETMQVTPEEFIQVKALQGDSSDNVPGVPKVGPKTATDLIVKYHTVAGVYEHLDEITRKALHENLAANREQAELSLFLVTIKTDCDLELDKTKARIKDSNLKSFYTRQAYEKFKELEFDNFLSRFDENTTRTNASSESENIQMITENADMQALFESANALIAGGGIVSVYPVFDPVSPEKSQRLLGLSVSLEGEDIFCFGIGDKITQEEMIAVLGRLRKTAQKSTRGGMVAVFDIKSQYAFWDIQRDEFKDKIRLNGMFDLLIGAYLCKPTENSYTPDKIANEYENKILDSQKEVLGKRSFEQAIKEDPETVLNYAGRVAGTIASCAKKVHKRLEEWEMLRLYEEVELPLSYVLYDMQKIGVRVLPDKLKEYGDQLTGRIAELTEMIHEEAGVAFNIASPKQLGEILFERMNLPGGKKTKTGWSTAADILEKLAPTHPFVANVLEYRALTKLKSTYADGLAAFIAEDERIHTSFNQTITATGRISASDPNLQNIPMRTEQGRAIRKVFVPKEGYLFADADYSQIELRILASFSGDDALIEAYKQGDDIHRMTASRVFGVPFEEVTDLQRRNAKAVNFGIVYGISSFGLSQGLSISRQEASEYIQQYFKMFPGIKKYLDDQVKQAKENGYSVTLMGRRRPIPELENSNFMQRQFGERVAMNAPIQGTGADIMKVAMLRVWERIERENLSSRLILQIHDELLIETAPGEEETVCKILEEEMMGAADLKVPLSIDCHLGADWYEAK